MVSPTAPSGPLSLLAALPSTRKEIGRANDLEAGSIVWAIKRPRGYLWGTRFRIFSDHKALENIGNVGGHNSRVQRWLKYLTAFGYTPEYRKGRQMVMLTPPPG